MAETIQSSAGEPIPVLRCSAIGWAIEPLERTGDQPGPVDPAILMTLEAMDDHGSIFAVAITITALDALSLVSYLSEIGAKVLEDGV